MDTPEIYDPQDLGRRQQMAAARRQRESARLALLDDLLDAQRRADGLKRWIAALSCPENGDPHPELQRMAGWANAQLDTLERTLSPEQIAATVRERDLFPNVDPLDDPKGEPPCARIWGHSAALWHINAA
ncbi:hypothetical protein [Shinella sp. G-2]|uniref:hypothetical protein n=1 Tax=Shinella sp. G-2 TaxID=3133141 RepID=UPI003D04A1B1